MLGADAADVATRVAAAPAGEQGALLARDLEEQRMRCGGLWQTQLHNLGGTAAVVLDARNHRFLLDESFLASAFNSIPERKLSAHGELAETARVAAEAEVENLHAMGLARSREAAAHRGQRAQAERGAARARGALAAGAGQSSERGV